jgi:hypothetical protein
MKKFLKTSFCFFTAAAISMSGRDRNFLFAKESIEKG